MDGTNQCKNEGTFPSLTEHIDRVHHGHNVGDIYKQSTFRDININNMLEGAIV